MLSVLANQKVRLGDIGYKWSSLWHEKSAKQDGYIEWLSGRPSSWRETILQGPHFTVSNPFVREPNDPCRSNKDWSLVDLTTLMGGELPWTNYKRECSRDMYDSATPRWGDLLATQYWRVAWRNMTQPGSERSLHAAIIAPGAAHVNAVHSLAICSEGGGVDQFVNGAGSQGLLRTALVAGFWSSLPFDYLVKVSGASKVNVEMIDRFPAPVDHPAWRLLLLRTLRLNCLTGDYAPLWNALYLPGFSDDTWTRVFTRYLDDLAVRTGDWHVSTPLRSDLQRRAALVEIDALCALMLGLSAEHLALMFRAQFPVLRKYENEMYFDAAGRKIAKEHHAQRSYYQQKDD